MKDLDHIILYTGENQDILKCPPSFLVKAGTYLICFTLVGIFALSNYIMLPDTVPTELTIKKSQIDYLTAFQDKVATRDGYLLETAYSTASFVNKGDTLFEIIPITEKNIEASFILPSKYKNDLQSGCGNLITLGEENRKYSFKILQIRNLRKDVIEVRINADPNLAKYFYRAEDGSYGLLVEVLINQQSIWSTLLSAIIPKAEENRLR